MVVIVIPFPVDDHHSQGVPIYYLLTGAFWGPNRKIEYRGGPGPNRKIEIQKGGLTGFYPILNYRSIGILHGNDK